MLIDVLAGIFYSVGVIVRFGQIERLAIYI